MGTWRYILRITVHALSIVSLTVGVIGPASRSALATSGAVDVDSRYPSPLLERAGPASVGGGRQATIDGGGALTETTPVPIANTPPGLSGLPDRLFDQSPSPPGAIDLWPYAWDAETPVDELIYELYNTPSTGAGVMLTDNRYVIADPSSTWCGGTDVTIRVTDPEGLWGTDTFRVAVSWSCPGPVAMPGAPVLIAPVDGGTAHSNTPAFAWHEVGGVQAYQLQVDDVDEGHPADFSSPEWDETTSVTEFALPSRLSDGTYTWRVRAVKGSELGDWSEGWAFTMGAPSPAEHKLYLPVVERNSSLSR